MRYKHIFGNTSGKNGMAFFNFRLLGDWVQVRTLDTSLGQHYINEQIECTAQQYPGSIQVENRTIDSCIVVKVCILQ